MSVITGGKSKKGGGGSDAENTLESVARARLIFAISEGPCEGLVGGEKSIFRNRTPLMNANGSLNVENVVWEEHKGYPDDTPFAGHTEVASPEMVEQEVKADIGPIVRTIVQPDADAVKVVVRLNSLFRLDKKKGTLKTHDVGYAIDLRPAGGTWKTRVFKEIVQEKCTSPVQFQHRIKLPLNGGPWDIRVRRTTPDETEEKNQSSVTFESFFVLVEGKYTYPHTGAVALEFNAEDIGGQIGDIAFRWRGLKVEVPSNYDAVTRSYDGIWDGTFKLAWTNNPAWIFRDLTLNERYGLGDLIQADTLNKWSLYQIARYCDGRVPSGVKKDDGSDLMEFRYTFNGVISTRREAYKALQGIIATWRGMGYWSLGQMFATADMPSDPVHLVSPANVEGGVLNYSSTATKARHTVALVSWNDPQDFYRPAIEVVVDNEAVRRFGWREKKVTLEGCTSRGLAHRHGRWILDVEQNEIETVTYRASLDQLQAVPGNIIAVADPRKANVRMAGRVVSTTATTITLDKMVHHANGQNYEISWVSKDGKVRKLPVASFNDVTRTVTLSSAVVPASRPVPDAMFVVTGTDVAPKQYRVLSVREVEKSIYEVTALQHDPAKYDRVERGIQFDLPPTSLAPAQVKKPTNLVVIENTDVVNGRTRTRLTFGWTPPTNVTVQGYIVDVKGPDITNSYAPIYKTVHDIEVLDAGSYTLSVRTVDIIGRKSKPASITYEVGGAGAIDGLFVDHLKIRQGGAIFTDKDARLIWRNNFPVTSAPGADPDTSEDSPLYSHNTVAIYRADTNELLRTARTTTSSYTYDFASNREDNLALGKQPARSLRVAVTLTSVSGATSPAHERVVSNPAPAVPILEASSSGKTINVGVTPSDEEDVRGVRIWIEKNSIFNPEITQPKLDGPGNFLSWEGQATTEYFVRAAVYDTFSKKDLNVSSPFSISTGFPAMVDTEAPDAPTNLRINSTSAKDGRSKVTFQWDASPSDDVISYDLEVKELGGEFIAFPTSTLRYEMDLPAGLQIVAKVCAEDRLGNKSLYTDDKSHTVARDTIPPPQVTGLEANAGFDAIWLKWDESSAEDIDYYEIFEATTATAPTASSQPSFRSAATTFARNALGEDQTRHYWVRGVDTSGNKGAWSASGSAKTIGMGEVTITAEDIAGLVDETSFAASIEPVKIFQVGALPTVKHTTNISYLGQLYRWDGSKYVKDVAASDITGKLTASQIAAAAIGVEQLAANAVQARHMGVGDFENYLGGEDYEGHWNLGAEHTISASATSQINRFLRLPTDGGNIGLARKITVEPGDEIYLSIWAWRTSDFDGDSNSKLRIGDQNGAFLAAIAYSATAIPATSWRFLETSFTVPADVTELTPTLWITGTTGHVNVARTCLRKKAKGEFIVDGAMKARHMAAEELITLSAQIKNAIITDAHINELSANKLKAGTALANTITVNNNTLGNLNSWASNPAQRINTSSTRIDPGKIMIYGSTSLSNWIHGGNSSSINGGAIAANTIAANKMTIGQRGVTLDRIQFEHNSPSANRVSWSSGWVRYTGDDGSQKSVWISASNAAWSSGALFIYWVKDSGSFNTTTNQSTATGSDRVILAAYRGGNTLSANYGRTVIDGAHIKTGTVDTDQLKARSITAGLLSTGTLITETAQIKDLTVDTIKIKNGAVTDFDQAGAGSVRDMSGNWRTLGSISLPTGGHKADIIGHLQITLTYQAGASTNNNARFQILLNGFDVVVEINNATLDANGSSYFVNHIITRRGITSNTTSIVLRMRNCDIRYANFWAMARKK